VTELLHITERATWEAARPAGEYRVSTRGVPLEQQGFIHFSLRHQLRGVAEFLYGAAGDGHTDDSDAEDSDADDLVVLVVDSERLGGAPLRYEAPEPGAEPFPHLYGPLPTEAVTAVLTVTRDDAGRLVLPQ
jgi:uncharacterized protein (DUF952 family)